MAGNDEHGGGLERTDEIAPTLMLAGKYRLGRLLGEGGMGAVYEAEHLGLGTTVAVKLLGEGSNTDPKSIARFKREAKAMGQIKHENVVRATSVERSGQMVPRSVDNLSSPRSTGSKSARAERV